MYDLFNPVPENLDDIPSINEGVNLSPINGLQYIPNFITCAEEKNLINAVNRATWLNDLKRRVQHYGYKYDYRARALNYSMYLGDLPEWTLLFTKRILKDKLIKENPDQLIVNEYLPGQGIANHVDCQPCFDETIFSLSLGSTCLMDFVNVQNKDAMSLLLEPRSLLLMTGEARYGWSHGIVGRKSDEYRGQNFARGTRISLTFRKVIF